MGNRITLRSTSSRCEQAVDGVRLTIATTPRTKPRARAMVRMLKLAMKPKHALLLHKHGAVVLCVELLEREQRTSAMRELALLALLCLSLDATVKRDSVLQLGERMVAVVSKVMRQERPATSTRYAAVAVLHSLSRDSDNLEVLYAEPNLIDGLTEAIAYEAEGSHLRKLACEILKSLSEVREFQISVYRSFSEVVSRLIVGELTVGTTVLELAFEILRNLAANEGNQESILSERVLTECALRTLSLRNSSLGELAQTKLFVLEMFYNLASGSETSTIRVAIVPRLPKACVECILPDVPQTDPYGMAAIRLLHLLTTFKAARVAVFSAPNVADVLYLQGKSNVYARMAYINLTGAFDEEDERDPERRALVGCEETDDMIVDMLEILAGESARNRGLTFQLQSNYGEDDLGIISAGGSEFRREGKNHSSYDGVSMSPTIGDGDYYSINADSESARKSTLLSIAVLLRRQHHFARLGKRVAPLVIQMLDRALADNDARTVTLALSCLQLLSKDPNTLSRETALPLLGRIQEKVHPAWKPARLDAERLVSGMQSSDYRLKPVVDMLERMLDGKQRGTSRPLDVPLASLTFALDSASTEEKRVTGRNLMRLLPRALRKAVNDGDALSARSAVDLFHKVMSVRAAQGDSDFEQEKARVAAAIKEITTSPAWKFDD